jgi:hypothetical protein
MAFQGQVPQEPRESMSPDVERAPPPFRPPRITSTIGLLPVGEAVHRYVGAGAIPAGNRSSQRAVRRKACAPLTGQCPATGHAVSHSENITPDAVVAVAIVGRLTIFLDKWPEYPIPGTPKSRA